MAIESNISGETLRVFVGEDKTLRYTIYTATATAETIADGTAECVDVGAWAVDWVLRKSDKAIDPALILKSSADSPASIAITGTFNADPAINTQRIEVFLLDTDTAAQDGSDVVLPPKTYRYSLKRKDEGAETILAFGDFELLEATAR
jgi:hypothetical protein